MSLFSTKSVSHLSVVTSIIYHDSEQNMYGGIITKGSGEIPCDVMCPKDNVFPKVQQSCC